MAAASVDEFVAANSRRLLDDLKELLASRAAGPMHPMCRVFDRFAGAR